MLAVSVRLVEVARHGDDWLRHGSTLTTSLCTCVQVSRFRFWCTVSIYLYRTDIESIGCYGIRRYNGKVMQLSNCVGVASDQNVSYFSYVG